MTGEAPGGGAYFHVPYCTHFCRYCRCYRRSLPLLKGHLDTYTAYVLQQLDFFAPYLDGFVGKYYSIGGGTPSILEPRQLTAIFERFLKNYKVAGDNPVSTFEMSVPTLTSVV